jgi:hypothetical protein
LPDKSAPARKGKMKRNILQTTTTIGNLKSKTALTTGSMAQLIALQNENQDFLEISFITKLISCG